MSKSEMTKAIVAPVHELVRPLGFRKSGATFTRDAGEVVHIINIQKSTSSTAEEVRVTANLGVWVKSLAPVRAGVPDKENILSAHWKERIGTLSPERYDKWWVARSISEATAVGKELTANIQQWGLPALSALSSPSALVKLWRSGVSPGLTEMQRERYIRQLAPEVA